MEPKIHPSADVQTDKIGDDTLVWQYCVILKDAEIGRNCNINCHCFVEGGVILGNNVTIKSGVYIWHGITMEDDVFIGPNVAFTNDLLPRSKRYPESFEKITIKKGASIGANATIVAPLKIGEYALIGAGSVVTKTVPPYTIWYGNPARHRGYITCDGRKVNLDLKDDNGKQFTYENETLIEL